jgi:hypothetical protein
MPDHQQCFPLFDRRLSLEEVVREREDRGEGTAQLMSHCGELTTGVHQASCLIFRAIGLGLGHRRVWSATTEKHSGSKTDPNQQTNGGRQQRGHELPTIHESGYDREPHSSRDGHWHGSVQIPMY